LEAAVKRVERTLREWRNQSGERAQASLPYYMGQAVGQANIVERRAMD
jgi:hypothetical protein